MDRMELTTQDGTGIFVRPWTPEGELKAVIIQVHGQGEHTERYQHVADYFNPKGYALLGYDHRGHGRSKGPRGHIPSYDSLMEELDIIMGKAAELYPDVPIIIYGHSWGGNIAANYLIRRQPKVRGAILTGSWFALPDTQKPSAFKATLAKVMNVIYPAFAEENQIDVNHLSTDEEVGKIYANDPLVHGKISAGAFVKSSQAAEYALQNASKVNVPVLILHGGDDPITAASGSRAFADAIGDGADLKIYPGMRHEIHNEVDKEKVLADMYDFIKIILQ